MVSVKILGTGCKKCKQLEENAREAILQVGIEADIIKVTELKDIMNYGVMMTPGLVIDEVVKSVGKVLEIDEIKKLLK
jgi:small redox-active disulfide protein 2